MPAEQRVSRRAGRRRRRGFCGLDGAGLPLEALAGPRQTAGLSRGVL